MYELIHCAATPGGSIGGWLPAGAMFHPWSTLNFFLRFLILDLARNRVTRRITKMTRTMLRSIVCPWNSNGMVPPAWFWLMLVSTSVSSRAMVWGVPDVELVDGETGDVELLSSRSEDPMLDLTCMDGRASMFTL